MDRTISSKEIKKCIILWELSSLLMILIFYFIARIGLTHDLPLGCLVDDDGKYIKSVGFDLAGLHIMGRLT